MTLHMPSKNPPDATEAPAATPPAGLRLPGEAPWPRIDDHVVRPGTREEMVRGRLVYAAPALEPHGDAHGELSFAVRGHARPGYIVSNELLTRVSVGSDFATDTCLRKAGIDPATGARYLEELAFEIVSTQSLRDITERAEDLAARGVRRIFAIFVKRSQVAEWSRAEAAFRPLGLDETIEDACLARPMPVRALLSAAENDNAVARALLAKNNAVIEQAKEAARREGLNEGRREGQREGRRDGLSEGLAEGRREAVERLCRVLGIELSDDRRAALARLDAAALEALAERIVRERCWPS